MASGEQAKVRLAPSDVATLMRIDGCNTLAMPSDAIVTSVRHVKSTSDGNEAQRCSAAATNAARDFLITAIKSSAYASGKRNSNKSFLILSVCQLKTLAWAMELLKDSSQRLFRVNTVVFFRKPQQKTMSKRTMLSCCPSSTRARDAKRDEQT